jgi:hypothetical protein
MLKKAYISSCLKYRYSLWRNWTSNEEQPPSNYALIVGLNPSSADETSDDPTIRKCIKFAQSWGYDALCMVNLFAYRATKPSEMFSASSPIGEENDRIILELAQNANVVVAAWGVWGAHLDRDKAVKNMLPNLTQLRLTKDGYPSHPLYLPPTLVPQAWN